MFTAIADLGVVRLHLLARHEDVEEAQIEEVDIVPWTAAGDLHHGLAGGERGRVTPTATIPALTHSPLCQTGAA